MDFKLRGSHLEHSDSQSNLLNEVAGPWNACKHLARICHYRCRSFVAIKISSWGHQCLSLISDDADAAFFCENLFQKPDAKKHKDIPFRCAGCGEW